MSEVRPGGALSRRAIRDRLRAEAPHDELVEPHDDASEAARPAQEPQTPPATIVEIEPASGSSPMSRRQRRAEWAASFTEEVPVLEPTAEPETPAADAGAEPAAEIIAQAEPEEPETQAEPAPRPAAAAAVPASIPAAPAAGDGAFDDLISRAVSSAGTVTTANALILPTLPDGQPLAGALTETGEVIVTGSLELPRELGETGGHARRHDTVDSGRFFDGSDIDVAPDDARPVAASRAISSRASRNAMITPATKKGNRLPLILSIVAGVLLIGVVVVVIVGAMHGAF